VKVYVRELLTHTYSNLSLYILTGYDGKHKLRILCPCCTDPRTTFKNKVILNYSIGLTCNECFYTSGLNKALIRYLSLNTIDLKISKDEIFFELEGFTIVI